MKPITYHIPGSQIRSQRFNGGQERQACRNGTIKNLHLLAPDVFVAKRLCPRNHERFCKRCGPLADLVVRLSQEKQK